MTDGDEKPSAVGHISGLRDSITDGQRDLLDHIWDARIRGGRFEWPPVTTTNLELDLAGTEAATALAPPGALQVLRSLPDRYGLTLLGVLLTTRGPKYLELLVRYLRHLCVKAKADPRLPQVKRAEVSAALSLGPEEGFALGHLLQVANLQGQSMSYGEDWLCGFPSDIDRLRFHPDLHEYVASIALRQGERAVAENAPRQVPGSASPSQGRRRRTFRFVKNAVLRKAVGVDWREACRARRVHAWRSCVIACGAVIEGMLLDAVEADEAGARAAFVGKFPGRALPFRRWSLNELAEVSLELGIVNDQSFHLTHALRFSRDLVHPGRAARLRASIGQAEAEIAVATVRHVYGVLAERRQREDARERMSVGTEPSP